MSTDPSGVKEKNVITHDLQRQAQGSKRLCSPGALESIFSSRSLLICVCRRKVLQISKKKKKKIVNVQWFDLVNQLRVQTIFLTNEWQCMVNIHSQTYHSGSLETVLKPLLTLLMWKCLSTDWNKIQQSLSLSAHSLIIDD